MKKILLMLMVLLLLVACEEKKSINSTEHIDESGNCTFEMTYDSSKETLDLLFKIWKHNIAFDEKLTLSVYDEEGLITSKEYLHTQRATQPILALELNAIDAHIFKEKPTDMTIKLHDSNGTLVTTYKLAKLLILNPYNYDEEENIRLVKEARSLYVVRGAELSIFEGMMQLEKLIIASNAYTDYSFLSLENLNYLYINLPSKETSITGLNALSAATQLKELSVIGGKHDIDDMLLNQKNLEFLRIIGSSIGDFSTLEGLRSLESLSYSDYIEIEGDTETTLDLSSLSIVGKLSVLNIYAPNKFIDFKELSNIKTLKHLFLHSKLLSVDSLEDFKELESLKLGIYENVQLPKLSKLLNLNSLMISNYAFLDTLDFISDIENLHELTLYEDGGKEQDYSFLGKLPKLKAINLELVYHSSSIEELASLSQLESLKIRLGSDTKDINFVTTMKHLKFLSLSYLGYLNNLDGLKNHKTLKSVEITHLNNVNDYSVLNTLENLKYLYLGDIDDTYLEVFDFKLEGINVIK